MYDVRVHDRAGQYVPASVGQRPGERQSCIYIILGSSRTCPVERNGDYAYMGRISKDHGQYWHKYRPLANYNEDQSNNLR